MEEKPLTPALSPSDGERGEALRISTSADTIGAMPNQTEYLGLFAMLVLLLALNLATYNQYPEVWCDEVWFSEPAVNLVKYGSFTTSTWQLQPANTFPAVNCPLYSMALVPWVAAFGTSVL